MASAMKARTPYLQLPVKSMTKTATTKWTRGKEYPVNLICGTGGTSTRLPAMPINFERGVNIPSTSSAAPPSPFPGPPAGC